MPQAGLFASFAFLRRGPLTLLASGGYDSGGASSTVRGDPSSLALHHLHLGVEGRWAFTKWLYASLLVAPAANFLAASVDDGASPAPLVSRRWSGGLDTAAGVGLLLGAAGNDESPSARFWLIYDLGYSFAGLSPMTLAPELDRNDPRQIGALTLPSIRPGGVASSLAFAVSF